MSRTRCEECVAPESWTLITNAGTRYRSRAGEQVSFRLFAGPSHLQAHHRVPASILVVPVYACQRIQTEIHDHEEEKARVGVSTVRRIDHLDYGECCRSFARGNRHSHPQVNPAAGNHRRRLQPTSTVFYVPWTRDAHIGACRSERARLHDR